MIALAGQMETRKIAPATDFDGRNRQARGHVSAGDVRWPKDSLYHSQPRTGHTRANDASRNGHTRTPDVTHLQSVGSRSIENYQCAAFHM